MIRKIKKYLATHCIHCGEHLDPNYSVCLTCYNQMKQWQIEWYNELIDNQN